MGGDGGSANIWCQANNAPNWLQSPGLPRKVSSDNEIARIRRRNFTVLRMQQSKKKRNNNNNSRMISLNLITQNLIA